MQCGVGNNAPSHPVFRCAKGYYSVVLEILPHQNCSENSLIVSFYHPHARPYLRYLYSIFLVFGCPFTPSCKTYTLYDCVVS